MVIVVEVVGVNRLVARAALLKFVVFRAQMHRQGLFFQLFLGNVSDTLCHAFEFVGVSWRHVGNTKKNSKPDVATRHSPQSCGKLVDLPP